MSVLHFVCQCHIFYVSATFCISVLHFVCQCSILYVSATFCKSLPHFVSQCHILYVSVTFCMSVLHFVSVPHFCMSVPHFVCQCHILYVSAAFCMSLPHFVCQCRILYVSATFFCWSERPYCVRASSLSILTDHTKTPQSVGLLWASGQPYAETCTLTTPKELKKRTPIPLTGFEPTGSEHP
jgi:hypothetical protein